MKFKKGDLITGTSKNHYGITNTKTICKVIEVDKYFSGETKLIVEILYTSEFSFRYLNNEKHVLDVNGKYFRKLTNKELEKSYKLIVANRI